MTRTSLLEKLINLKGSVDVIMDELNKFNWDSDNELVTLTKQQILNALNNYIEGRITGTEIENWANAIESREDIGREKTHINLIDQVLYELANPYLTEQLTHERAKILNAKLEESAHFSK
ncbi:MAG: hypothetical protein H0U71_02965 [Gammaproteobacteria bacterium]|nr:hypothetical protein [Gammaproteobacteria bacterium]